MTVTENELRDLLRTRSDLPESATFAPGRLDAVRGRIVRRRRRRAAVAGAVTVIALVIGGLGWVGPLGRWVERRNSMPAVPAPPEYDSGRRLVGTVPLNTRSGSATFTFVPRTWDLTPVARCSGLPDVKVRVEVEGVDLGEAGCSGSGTFADVDEQIAAAGLTLGVPVTVTFQLLVPGPDGPNCFGCSSRLPSKNELRGVGVIGALYERVPREEYPFPPKPATLAKLDHLQRGEAGLEASAARPNGSWPLRVRLTPGASLSIQTIAPGTVEVRLGSVKILSPRESWTYENASVLTEVDLDLLRGSGQSVQVGDVVTLTVTASYFSDPAWVVRWVGGEGQVVTTGGHG